MGRLTERDEFGNTDIIGVDSMDLQCNLEFDEFNKVTNALNKLAEYEELEERCCKENSWGLKMLTEKWKEFIEDIQELYEYRKAEEQNRLIKLPCAVGDTVYSFSFYRVYVMHVESFITYEDHIDVRLVSDTPENPFLKCDIDIKELGKRWFLTREVAEAALKELERGKGE